MIINDIAEVIYAPAKAFKRIIEKPQYLGAIIIILLFTVVMIGYEYTEFSKVYVENTTPQIGELSTFTNATYWNAATGVNVSNNYVDFYNYSVYVAGLGNYNLFTNSTHDVGPSSLEISAANSNIVTVALTNTSNVNCGTKGFENLSMTMKQVAPQNMPQSATLTLYSLNDTSFFTYDLTSLVSHESINVWNNYTIQVGLNAQGWTSTGTPAWGNITSLKLEFAYPNSSNVTIHIGALFFRGQYINVLQAGSTNFLLGFLETFPLQILFSWLILTGVIYLFLKGLKTDIVWKPLFIAVSFALIVLVIRGLISLVTALTLPALYFPYDVAPGGTTNFLGAISYPTQLAGTLTPMSQAAVTTINSSTEALGTVTFAMFAFSYIWLGALCTIIIGTLKPEFSMVKKVAISAVSVGVTILLLLLFVGAV